MSYQQVKKGAVMKCPFCERNGEASKLRALGGSRTLLSTQPYYDEEGKYHAGDSNTYRFGFSCSKGHTFELIRKEGVPDEVKLR